METKQQIKEDLFKAILKAMAECDEERLSQLAAAYNELIYGK